MTVENKKKELAFQADRKVLLAKNEKLQTMIDTMQMSGGAGAGKSRDVSKYKEHIRKMEEDKEKIMADHGAVSANMQKRYSEEVSKVKQHEKTVVKFCKLIFECECEFRSPSSTNKFTLKTSKFKQMQRL